MPSNLGLCKGGDSHANPNSELNIALPRGCWGQRLTASVKEVAVHGLLLKSTYERAHIFGRVASQGSFLEVFTFSSFGVHLFS